MEEDVMLANHPARGRHDAGFSMVEMLMSAFILAVGLLGLAMLQTLSVRVATGTHNLELAIQLAEQVMDQVELEGRQTYLNANFTDPPGAALGTLAYINQAAVDQYFKLSPPGGSSPGALIPATNASYLFHLQMTQAAAVGTTGLSDVQVQVQFSDATNARTNLPIVRTVQIARRILHG
jgi:prepilin-type N-terminal cleavage/methylation domain-containing protein